MTVFISHTEKDIAGMLDYIGLSSLDDLFSEIPEEVILRKRLNIPKLDEKSLYYKFREKISENRHLKPENIYLGGGIWPIYIPSVVKTIISRSEFLTSYTPYQPEVSQGILQALYEYQSLIAELVDMDIVNSSMYDWSTAAAEALLMSSRVTKKKTILIPEDLPSNRKEVLKTYLWGAGLRYIEYPLTNEGDIDDKVLSSCVDCAGIYVEYPNSYGYLYDGLEEISEKIHSIGGLLIMGVDPISLVLLKPPSYYDADIVVGEGQILGNPSFFGGPLLGIFAVKGDMKLIREMPGRIIGLTRSVDNERAFTMILQTREQHIRREKATSNICSNEALTAVASGVYLSLMGKDGLLSLAKKLLVLSHNLYNKLISIGFKDLYTKPFYREFSLKIDDPYSTDEVLSYLLRRNILFGKKVNRGHVISINEFHSEEAFDTLTSLIKEVVNHV